MQSMSAVSMACFLCVAACATPPPKSATGSEADAALAAFKDSEKKALGGEGDTNISIDPRIMAKCALPIAHFNFDSSHIRTGEAPALDALAQCFTKGPMQGHDLMLVGHADPRGELTYNFALGQQRAGSVAEYLGLHGMGDDRILTSSLGELEAVGTNPDSWARDRRVEVLLRDD